MKDLLSREDRSSHRDNFATLSQRILRSANRGAARMEFLTEISTMLLDSLEFDAVELRLRDRQLHDEELYSAVERALNKMSS